MNKGNGFISDPARAGQADVEEQPAQVAEDARNAVIERWQAIIAAATPAQYQLALRLGASTLTVEEACDVLGAAPADGSAADDHGFAAQLARFVREPGNA